MTPITYSEAAELLGVKVDALRNAAFRGVLSRLPRTGTKQPLIREQVALFRGKPRLSLHSLSTQEKETWARLAEMAERRPANTREPQQTAQENASGADLAALGLLAGGAGALALMPVILPSAGASMPGMGVPQGSPFPVLQVSLKIIR